MLNRFILLPALGVIAFLLISNTFNFRDVLFGSLFPKPSSQAAESLNSAYVFTNKAGEPYPVSRDGEAVLIDSLEVQIRLEKESLLTGP